MKRFLQTKVGLVSVGVFVVFMAFMSIRMLQRDRGARNGGVAGGLPMPLMPKEGVRSSSPKAKSSEPSPKGALPASQGDRPSSGSLPQEDLLYLDRVKQADSRSSTERDGNGLQITRRRTPSSLAKSKTSPGDDSGMEETPRSGGALRLAGRSSGRSSKEPSAAPKPAMESTASGQDRMSENPLCFVPYGRPIKCELVFTVDSTMEQTPLVGLIMEPVYNNGFLVIPSGAELHGMARPDRLRDRIFSSPEWMLIFPRDGILPNGRQLSVHGLALDRVEPQSSGLTWGITDGSYGLQGDVIRSLESEEIKRFAATFLSAGALALQQTETTARGTARIAANARNATLEGIAASLEEWSKRIGDEIARNGVFIRVAGGKQFYFYPQQTIVPSRAEIPR